MDKEAFTRRYQENFRLVWNVCLTLLRDPSDTEDAVQDAFLRLMSCRKDFASEEHLRAWLIVTAKNVCRDELRRHRRRELPLDEARDMPAASPELDETLEAVRALPEKYRLPIYLFYYEECSVAQIADLLHRREATVRSDLHRGREQLRQMLERSTK